MKDLVRLLRRIAVTVVGTVILAVGVVLLVAPGPGLLVILLALIVFAAEYEWARRHLAAIRVRARSAADKAAASRVATAAAILFGIGAIGLGAVLIFTDVLPLSGVGTGAGVALGGLTVLATTAYSVRELRRAERPVRSDVPRPERLKSSMNHERGAAMREAEARAGHDWCDPSKGTLVSKIPDGWSGPRGPER
jgi:hypothetical protein